MYVAIFWDIALSRKISRARNQPPAARCFLARMIFGPEDRGNMFLRNVGSQTNYKALYTSGNIHNYRCENLKSRINSHEFMFNDHEPTGLCANVVIHFQQTKWCHITHSAVGKGPHWWHQRSYAGLQVLKTVAMESSNLGGRRGE
jgi:hypothetical protein